MLLKRSLWLFVIPASWVVLFGTAETVEKTPWGASGHPSNGIVMQIVVLLCAPLFGLVGCVYAVLRKGPHSFPTKLIAIVTNLCLIGLGAFFWLRWFR